MIKSVLRNFANSQVFSCEFCKIYKNTFFTEHLRTTASVSLQIIFESESIRQMFVCEILQLVYIKVELLPCWRLFGEILYVIKKVLENLSNRNKNCTDLAISKLKSSFRKIMKYFLLFIYE